MKKNIEKEIKEAQEMFLTSEEAVKLELAMSKIMKSKVDVELMQKKIENVEVNAMLLDYAKKDMLSEKELLTKQHDTLKSRVILLKEDHNKYVEEIKSKYKIEKDFGFNPHTLQII